MRPCRIADHRLIEAGGRWFVFLPAQNAIFEVDEETRKRIGRYHADPDLLNGDLAEAGSSPAEPIPSFMRLGVVEPVERSGVPPWREPGEIPLQTLVLHLTDACNLGCTYCYHGESGTAGNSGAMPHEIALKGVDLLMARSGKLETVTLVLFGGEPLLRFREIRKIASYARRQAEERGKTLRLALTTNGVLLTDEIVGFLQDAGVSVTVSMDGPPDIHDRNRPFPDGSPSFSAVSKGVARLMQGEKRLPVVARVTVARNPDHVPRTLDTLLELGFTEVGFSPVTTRDAAHQLDEAGMDRLLIHFRSLSDRFLETAGTGDLLGFTNLIDLLVTLHEGEVKTHPCGAGLGMLSVGIDGTLYLCQRLIGREDLVMGSVMDGIDADRIARFRKQGALAGRQTCHACMARHICAGGCYHEALVRQGDLIRPNRHYCKWIQNWLEIGLSVYARISADQPDYLDKLSLLRGHKPFYDGAVMR